MTMIFWFGSEQKATKIILFLSYFLFFFRTESGKRRRNGSKEKMAKKTLLTCYTHPRKSKNTIKIKKGIKCAKQNEKRRKTEVPEGKNKEKLGCLNS